MQPTLRQTPPQYFFSINTDLEAELRGADGSDVPTGAGTEDDDIEMLAHGGEPSSSLTGVGVKWMATPGIGYAVAGRGSRIWR